MVLEQRWSAVPGLVVWVFNMFALHSVLCVVTSTHPGSLYFIFYFTFYFFFRFPLVRSMENCGRGDGSIRRLRAANKLLCIIVIIVAIVIIIITYVFVSNLAAFLSLSVF